MNLKVLPFPGSLSTQIFPPIISTSCLEMASPSPVPAVFARGRGIGLGKGLEQSALLLRRHADTGIAHRELESNLVFALLDESDTETTTSPVSVNLTALLVRLINT